MAALPAIPYPTIDLHLHTGVAFSSNTIGGHRMSAPVAAPQVTEGSQHGGALDRLRTAARLVHLLLAVLIVLAVFAQVYLIGAYIFGAGEGALEAHTSVGWSTHTAEMVLFLMALVAWLPRTDLVLSFALVVIGTVQVILAGSVEWVGALHPLFALVVLIIAATLAHRAIRRRRAGSRP